MIYVDTSALVPLFVPEPSTLRVERWFEAHSSDEIAVSEWTLTEFASAMGLKVRARELTRDTARAAQSLLERRSSESFRVLTPESPDFALAKEYLDDYALCLRAGDALHLGIARNREASSVISLDRTFIAAGQRLAIPTALLT
jgi:predicted nucleic acid-binding protein